MASSDPILRSRSYVKADEDLELLRRDELRPVRLQLELLKPELIQQEQGVDSTIVVFGSARTLDPETAKRELEQARSELSQALTDPQRTGRGDRVKSPRAGPPRCRFQSMEREPRRPSANPSKPAPNTVAAAPTRKIAKLGSGMPLAIAHSRWCSAFGQTV